MWNFSDFRIFKVMKFAWDAQEAKRKDSFAFFFCQVRYIKQEFLQIIP